MMCFSRTDHPRTIARSAKRNVERRPPASPFTRSLALSFADIVGTQCSDLRQRSAYPHKKARSTRPGRVLFHAISRPSRSIAWTLWKMYQRGTLRRYLPPTNTAGENPSASSAASIVSTGTSGCATSDLISAKSPATVTSAYSNAGVSRKNRAISQNPTRSSALTVSTIAGNIPCLRAISPFSRRSPRKSPFLTSGRVWPFCMWSDIILSPASASFAAVSSVKSMPFVSDAATSPSSVSQRTISSTCGCISGSPPLSETALRLRCARRTASSSFSRSSVLHSISRAAL